jgi:hypothetical protein
MKFKSVKRKGDSQRTLRHRALEMAEKRRKGAMLGYKGY